MMALKAHPSFVGRRFVECIVIFFDLDGDLGLAYSCQRRCTGEKHTSAMRNLSLSRVKAWPSINRRFLSGRSAAIWSLHLTVCANLKVSVADMISCTYAFTTASEAKVEYIDRVSVGVSVSEGRLCCSLYSR